MTCRGCQHENRATAKFCENCGTPLAAAPLASPETYTPRHLTEKILTSRTSLEGERKQVTVLFADMKGSMELIADRDPETARKILDPVLQLMMDAVHLYEGTVNQVMGDGIMALFGAPVAHEDHAVRACYAALGIQDAIRRQSDRTRRVHGVEVQVRVGLNSGEVVVGSIGSDLRMDYTAVGQTTHLAARMEQLAPAGSTRITASTLRLAEGFVQVSDLGPVPVKGVDAPVAVYDLVGAGQARTRLQAAAARGLSHFVGRDAEMGELRAALEQARGGRGQVVAVVGEPGVGKSRLFHELAHSHRVSGCLTLDTRSVSYGRATAYLPVIELLKAYLRIADQDDTRTIRARVTGHALTLDEGLKDVIPPVLWLLDALPGDDAFARLEPAQRRQRTRDALKRLLLREGQVQPLILIVEDLHWIDGETQVLLDALVESLAATSVLLLVNYRPEYRHGWAGKTHYRQLRIDPLPATSAAELLRGLLGAGADLDPLKRLLIARTEGNPLFLEESVRTLVETGALAGERGAYRLTRPTESLQMPPSVQAILAARVDRLGPEDKRLLQAAAVIGKDVPMPLLLAIAESREGEVRAGLGRLQAAEFLYESRLFPDLEYVQARPHPRGDLRQPPPRPAARAPRDGGAGHRGPAAGPARRAARAAGPPRVSRGAMGSGRDVSARGRLEGPGPVSPSRGRHPSRARPDRAAASPRHRGDASAGHRRAARAGAGLRGGGPLWRPPAADGRGRAPGRGVGRPVETGTRPAPNVAGGADVRRLCPGPGHGSPRRGGGPDHRRSVPGVRVAPPARADLPRRGRQRDGR
jgi:class 3 adenylate cyclase